MCTYDQCPEPNVLYDSWEEWTRHEQWTHQQRIWRCLEHPQHEFVHLAAYEGHVRIYHAESVHQMLSSELLKFQESVSQECDRPCPFCHGDFERPHDMQQHLAGHLEAIALLSLPNLDGIDNNSEAGKVESNEANRNYAESKADDFDRTIPLVFRDNDGSEAIPLATKTDSELFEFSLKAESVSFERRNETTIEAHADYSKEIVGKWLSELQYQESSPTKDWQPIPPHAFIQTIIDQRDNVFKGRNTIAAARNVPDLPSQEEKSSTHHWLPDVFDQSRPATFLEDSGQTSVLLGPHRPRCMARLSESYTNLLELPFEHGDFLVRIYYRSHDARSRILCSVQPPRSQKDSDLPLVSLSVQRSGPLLKLLHVDASGVNLWAALKFSTYESMFIDLCSISPWVVALRAAGLAECSP